MEHLENFPKWIKEISRFCKVKNSFVLTGNIYDAYLYENELIENIEEYLSQFLIEKEHYKKVVLYEPLKGFKGLGSFNYEEEVKGLDVAYQTIEKLFSETEKEDSNEPIAIVINYTSRIKDIAKNEQDIFFYNIFESRFGNS